MLNWIPYLKLIPRKRRLGRAKPQNIHNTTNRPRPHALILMRQNLRSRQLLRNLGQRARINILLFQLSQLLRERLQALEQIRNGNRGPSHAPGNRFIELEAGRLALVRRCFFGMVFGLVHDFCCRRRSRRGTLTSARRHRGRGAGKQRARTGRLLFSAPCEMDGGRRGYRRDKTENKTRQVETGRKTL